MKEIYNTSNHGPYENESPVPIVKRFSSYKYMMTTPHFIFIKPDGVEDAHEDLPFDTSVFKKPEEKPSTNSPSHQIMQSNTRVRFAILIDGVLHGYVNSLPFALEMVRCRFNDLMSQLHRDQQTNTFRVKYDVQDQTVPSESVVTSAQAGQGGPPSNVHRVCKLYQVHAGRIYNTYTKIQTLEIQSLARLEFKKP
jgi:hypothetical protein